MILTCIFKLEKHQQIKTTASRIKNIIKQKSRKSSLELQRWGRGPCRWGRVCAGHDAEPRKAWQPHSQDPGWKGQQLVPGGHCLECQDQACLDLFSQCWGPLGVPEFSAPEGFLMSQERASRRTELLGEHFLCPHTPRCTLGFFLQSGSFCENCSPRTEEPCSCIDTMVEKLNTNVELYQSLQKLLIEQLVGSFDPETKWMARLSVWFWNHGIHLNK